MDTMIQLMNDFKDYVIKKIEYSVNFRMKELERLMTKHSHLRVLLGNLAKENLNPSFL